MALALPLELQQQILQYLDARSFYAARQVDRRWNQASRDPVTLQEQLRKLPVTPHVTATNTPYAELHRLYHNAIDTCQVGTRVVQSKSDGQNLPNGINMSKVAFSGEGKRAVSLDARQLILYDITYSPAIVLSQRPINDLRTALGGGPWFKCAPTSVYELALSQKGNLLAVALDRTIQIYDLDAGDESWPIAAYISSAAGHFIAGLDFEHNDSLLKVQLSGKGTVLYVGTPSDTPANLEHWSSTGGLKHAFLDTSKMTIRSELGTPPTGPMEAATDDALDPASVPRLAALQILRPLDNGFLFAAQKHSPTSSNYCLGHFAVESIHNHVNTAMNQATVLCELKFALPPAACAAPMWDLLPSGYEQHARFAVSEDGRLLALAEKKKGCDAHSPEHQLFVYRSPAAASLDEMLQSIRDTDNTTAANEGMSRREPGLKHIVHRLPIYLGDVHGRLMNFDVQRDRFGHALNVTTNVERKRWNLHRQ